MRIHHLNCISTCPLGGRLMDGRSRGYVQRGRLCCHCMLIETPAGLVLVDTGLGMQDVLHPRERLSGFFLGLLKPDFRAEMTAYHQIISLGFSPHDVRHIVLTHLDFDHAGGLSDFPDAMVHLLPAEIENAQAQRTWLDRQRYRPQQWDGVRHWNACRPGSEPWHGFECVRNLPGVPPELLLVPLRGHTHGHCGVAVQQKSGWLLYAGDAYSDPREMHEPPHCRAGLRMYQTLMEKDRGARLHNQQRLRSLVGAAAGDVDAFCAHDIGDFERLSGRSARVPADRMSEATVAA